MNADYLEKLLVATAERRAAAHGMRFGQGADSAIREFARSGAEQILSGDHVRGLRNKSIGDTVAAFERLVDMMVSASGEIPGYREAQPGVIGEDTLARALTWICPLFPFC